jgi:enoyl-CoA hydratase/carnithine racemase
MHIMMQETRNERVITIQINEPEIDGNLVGSLDSALQGAGSGENTNVVFLFEGHAGSAVGGFPSWQPGPAREDMRYFARWEELLANISRLRAKTFVGYRGWVGPAAVQLGCVVDLRLASVGARLQVGSLARGCFPGTSAYWLPKFVGLGVARRLLLLGGELEAEEAVRLGLVDLIGPDLPALVEGAVGRLRPISAEAACFLRRILDESYRHERVSALEQLKAARYKVDGCPREAGLE